MCNICDLLINVGITMEKWLSFNAFMSLNVAQLQDSYL